MKTLYIRIEDDLHAEVARLAKADSRSVTAWVALILKNATAKNKPLGAVGKSHTPENNA